MLSFTNYGFMNTDQKARHAWGLALIAFVLAHFCYNYIPLALKAHENLRLAEIRTKLNKHNLKAEMEKKMERIQQR